MTEHTLKTMDVYWDAISNGEKNFDVRRDDRGFQKGDLLTLVRVEWREHGSGGKRLVETTFDGRACVLNRKITYILTGGQFGIEPGYVVMGLRKA